MKSENEVRIVIESLLGESTIRQYCLGVLADYIDYANELGSSIWSVTLNPVFITLNVGKIPVYRIWKSKLYFVFDIEDLTIRELNQIKQKALKTDIYHFPLLSSVMDIEIEDHKILEILPLVNKLYRSAIQKAATTINHNQRVSSYISHSHSLVNYLQTALVRDIPHPDYSEDWMHFLNSIPRFNLGISG
ncbi:MAG: hypothetical protein HEQ35_09545 [Gloeotrichia echinulata IR180]